MKKRKGEKKWRGDQFARRMTLVVVVVVVVANGNGFKIRLMKFQLTKDKARKREKKAREPRRELRQRQLGFQRKKMKLKNGKLCWMMSFCSRRWDHGKGVGWRLVLAIGRNPMIANAFDRLNRNMNDNICWNQRSTIQSGHVTSSSLTFIDVVYF